MTLGHAYATLEARTRGPGGATHPSYGPVGNQEDLLLRSVSVGVVSSDCDVLTAQCPVFQ